MNMFLPVNPDFSGQRAILMPVAAAEWWLHHQNGIVSKLSFADVGSR
jgi:hypothetical protein